MVKVYFDPSTFGCIRNLNLSMVLELMYSVSDAAVKIFFVSDTFQIKKKSRQNEKI